MGLLTGWSEAIKVVREAQRLAFAGDPLPRKCGLHLTFDADLERIALSDIESEVMRFFPHRFSFGHEKWMKINYPGKYEVTSSGNELENNINGTTLDPSQWLDRCRELYLSMKQGTKDLASPALMTLKQAQGFWPLVVSGEVFFDYWCLNTHVPGFLRNKESGVGDYWEWVKIARELILFRNKTKKSVIISEAGNGQSSFALTQVDCRFLFWIHELILTDRLTALLFYDSNLIKYHNGIAVLKLGV